jgi:hypothetical protein
MSGDQLASLKQRDPAREARRTKANDPNPEGRHTMNPTLSMLVARERVADMVREADRQRRVARPHHAVQGQARVVAGAHRLRGALWLHGRRES